MLEKDKKLREAAAAEARRRIEADRKKASPRVKKLLAHIEQHLFDSKLDSTSLMRACEVRDKSMPTIFHREVGTAPMRYLRDLRMDVAVRLLTDTELAPWKVGHLVFDVSGASFYGRFSRWSDMSPTAFRKAARKATREVAGEPEGQELREIGLALFLGESGNLELDQLDRSIRHLAALRAVEAPAPPSALAIDGATVERGIALALWERLRYLPPREQREAVRQPGALSTTVLFDVLREKSREEGRKDRQAGVRLAELALASLDGVAAHLTPEELANKQAQGWAWLANARRLALDYPAAKRAFAKARKLLPEDPDPQVLAEISGLEGELLLFQSKLKEALELKDRAVELFRPLENEEALAAALVAKAMTIGRIRGYESAIPDLVDALKLLDTKSQPYLVVAAHQNLLLAYALCGQHAEAIKRLPEVRSLCGRVNDPVILHQLQWTEGLIRQAQGDYEAAERHALEAQQGFALLGELGFAAAVDLDLAEPRGKNVVAKARLTVAQGRPGENRG
ncbi:MAG: hypothetical protein V3T72_16105 [Thermoanaerobaculia bacterium]